MAHIVILGAGIGGMPMAFEMREAARKEDRITVISNNPNFHFVPSNPWVAVNWRTRDNIELPIEPILKKKKIDFIPVAAKRVPRKKTASSWKTGAVLSMTIWSLPPAPSWRSTRWKA